MIRSLRTRFFLTVWPLIAGTAVVVGLLLTRWVAVEMVARQAPGPVVPPALLAQTAARWPALRGPGASDALRTLRDEVRLPNDIVALDATGAVLATTDATADVSVSGEHAEVRRVLGGGRAEQRLLLSRLPVRAGDGTVVGSLVVLPPAVEPPSPAVGAYRRIWTAVALASLVAAAATLLLATPVIRRVRALRDAATDVEAGHHARRVSTTFGDELGELEASFDSMAARIERSEAVKRRMLSDIAHELRTPLTNIVGLIEAARDGLRTPDAATLTSLAEEAQLLTRLIDDLQELSLAEARALRLVPEAVVVCDEAQRVADAFRGAGVAIEVTRGGDAGREDATIHVDRGRFGQVLRNLVRNAVTHSPPSGRVTLDVDVGRDVVAVRVVDHGPGIAAADLPLIWERFRRLDPSRQRASGGMGLGLPLARELTHAMGGTIAVTSAVGRGTTFEVRFPRRAADVFTPS